MFSGKTIGFGLCGSFCTLNDAIDQLEALSKTGCRILPVVSHAVATTDTRFGEARQFISRIEEICGARVINTIAGAEPIGPRKLLDLMVVMPCTGNTLAKLNCGITDTPVTMACKSHLRNARPLLLSVATNDGLAINAENIGALMSRRNVYFVPMRQDDAAGKPTSIIADMSALLPAAQAALMGSSLQPQLLG